jgi:uncharacterized membrane protein YcaP (DUF421 family)
MAWDFGFHNPALPLEVRMETLWSGTNWALGLDADNLSVWQMGFRAVLVYVIGIALVRIGEKRFIGKFAAFDVIMGIMIGSILSRAITTAPDFFPTLAAALVLILMHYAFAALAFHSEWFGDLVKGSARTLVIEGRIQWEAMSAGHISEKDLMSALRENGKANDLSRVKLARLERSGNISVLLDDG